MSLENCYLQCWDFTLAISAPSNELIFCCQTKLNVGYGSVQYYRQFCLLILTVNLFHSINLIQLISSMTISFYVFNKPFYIINTLIYYHISYYILKVFTFKHLIQSGYML